ncbi:hypothetical protein HYV11_01255 [Candidatus Dependentiae bacterium]|nr:hypothetical protein [Candidatus Dependentiae bacterium]
MKKLYCKWFYFFIIFSWFHVVHSGFSGKTLVKTPSGYIPIKQLKVGDQVYGVSKEGIISPTIITHKVKCKRSTYFSISIDNQTLTVANGQKFLLPLKHLWRKAKNLHEKDEVLTAFYDSIQVSVVKQKHTQKKFYDVRLQKDHAFLVTPQDIIVHNMPLFNIGVLISFEGFKFAVETVWAGVCFFGLWLGSKFLRSEKKVLPVLLPAGNTDCLNDQLDDHDHWLSCEKNNSIFSKLIFSESKKDNQDDEGNDKNGFNPNKDKENEDAQAPGKPTKDDGFVPPKKWDGKKRKHPKTGQVGWSDQDGNLWKPTGPGSQAHGGPHWDVTSEDGKKHWNIYPGGKIR